MCGLAAWQVDAGGIDGEIESAETFDTTCNRRLDACIGRNVQFNGENVSRCECRSKGSKSFGVPVREDKFGAEIG